MSRPRISRICAVDKLNKGLSSKLMSPLTLALFGSVRIKAVHMVDLPLPDSPTTPTIWPRSTLKLAFETAAIGCSAEPNCTLRSRTVSRGMMVFLQTGTWIEFGVQPIANRTKTQDGNKDRSAWEKRQPPSKTHEGFCVRKHDTPRDAGRLYAKPEK